MLKKALIVSLFFTSVSFGQYWQSLWGQPDATDTRTLDDTKTLQQYYQNMFQFNKNETQQPLTPSFQVDKDKILEKLRQSVPSDGAIDPDKYIVGPGDLLEIDAIGEVPFNFTLPVNPEGGVVIPNFGAVSLKNKTLDETKRLISSKMKENLKKGEIYTTLLAPRIFSVSVSGVVDNPGSYYASSVNRVETVVYLANLQNPLEKSEIAAQQTKERELINHPEYIQYFNDERTITEKTEMSLRNIKLIRQTGDTLHVDLIRYYATGDKEYNPYLFEGDRVIVPNFSDKNENTLSVSGAVVLEGTYEYTQFDSILTMIGIAQGVKSNADLTNTTLFRLNKEKNEYTSKVFDLEKIIKGESENFPLLPGDRVVVPEKRTEHKPGFVVIKGEVADPGIYPIIEGKSAILDVIKMAGGFTPAASLSESKIIRYSDPLDKTMENPDYKRIVNMRLSDMNNRQRQYYNFEAAIDRKFLSVDFQKLFFEKDSSQNVLLEHNDMILVPKRMNAIYVYGQVARPGYLNFTSGFDYEKYIELAGGTTISANEDDIRIIKAGSKNWLEPGDTELEPGDAIWVPRERDTDFEFYFGWFSRIVAVLGGVATIILLVTK